MSKTKTIPQVIAQFVGKDHAFNGLFVYEALNRYAQHVMSLDPKDYERSLVSLNLMQEIAQQWRDLTHEESKK